MRGALIGLSCAVLATAVVLLLWWRDNSAPESFAVADERQFVLVGTDHSREPQPATLHLTMSDGRDVSSLSLEGVVTAVHLNSGQLGMADPVLDLDGITRRALISEQPPYRILEFGARGDDVADAAAFLYSSGFLDSPEHLVFGPKMQRAVGEFERVNGLVVMREFQPHYVIWVPTRHAGIVLRVRHRIIRGV